MIAKPKNQNGFTLLEMLISIGIFSILVIASVGITLGVSNAHIKASNVQSVLDNTRFSLELMSKEIRTGANFTNTGITCGALTNQIIKFDSTSGRRIYFLDSIQKKIKRATSNITSIVQCTDDTIVRQFTADEVSVDNLNFIINGNIPGPSDGQPMVSINIQISSRGAKFGSETKINLQTTVVQRLRDL